MASSCDQFCLKSDCVKLQAELDRLKKDFELLKRDFNRHLRQEIPQAHKVDRPDITLDFSRDRLTASIGLLGERATDNVTLPYFLKKDGENLEKDFADHLKKEIPEAHKLEIKPKVEVSSKKGKLTTKVTVGGNSDSDTTELDLVLKPKVELSQNKNKLTTKVTVGGNSDSDTVTLDSLDLKPKLSLTANKGEIKGEIEINGKKANDSTKLNLKPYITIEQKQQALEARIQVAGEKDSSKISFNP